VELYNFGMIAGRSKIRYRLLASLCVLFSANVVRAQVIQQQTVQLPTFHYFGVQTTVVVPDQGSIPLGGVTYGGSTRTRFDRVGPNYGYGQFNETLGLSLSATIIDHDEMDREVLAEAARKRGAKFDVLGRPVDEDQPKARQALASPRIDQPRERVGGTTYLRRGREAEVARQPELAKVFYRRAAKLGNAIEKRTAEERLAAIAGEDSAR
jgi:hypothetical protein